MSPRRYASLLLITASRGTAAQFARLLPADKFAPEYNVCSALEAGFVLRESAYDVVVIDDSVPMEDGHRIAAAAAERGAANILMLADEEHFRQTAAFTEANGFMALQSPAEPELLKQSLGMMASVSARIRDLEEQTESLKNRVDEIRVIDRAKLLLIQRLKMTEKEAHRFIEKNAMDRCVNRRSIAENIIRTYQN